ncbi:transporter [Glaesserella sp.]|uniref:transporter n=1 Tax=Glaesserella sp. TaxID=2094731 RepID=UPI0035A04F5E
MHKIFLSLFFYVIFIFSGATAGWLAAEEFQTPEWKSTAQFEAPKVVDLGNYYALYSTYQLVKGGSSQNSYLDEEVTQNSFIEFKRNLTSPDVLQHFLVQNEWVKRIAAEQKQPVALVAQGLLARFQYDENRNSFSLTLTSPEESARLLSEFIQFVTLQTRAILNDELVAKWKILFQQVKQSAESNLGAIQQGGQIAQQDWNGKLNMMRSVQPLDNQLKPFRFIKSPKVPQKAEAPEDQSLWAVIGGAIGLLLAFFIWFLSAVTRGDFKKSDG